MSGFQVETALPILRAVSGHYEPAPFYLTRDAFGGLPVEVAGGEISDLVGKPVAAPHRHDVPEIYLLLSPTPGGATIRVDIDDQHVELTSPSALYVPAGSLHCFTTVDAEVGSYCLGVLIHGSQSNA